MCPGHLSDPELTAQLHVKEYSSVRFPNKESYE